MTTTYTIYEYATVAPNGQPVEPASTRTTAQAAGVAVQMRASTVFVAVTAASAAMNLRISPDGSAATTADYGIEAGKNYGFPIQPRSRPYLYGL